MTVYIKSFGGQKGGLSEPPRTPPAYGPAFNQVVVSPLFEEIVINTVNTLL